MADAWFFIFVGVAVSLPAGLLIGSAHARQNVAREMATLRREAKETKRRNDFLQSVIDKYRQAYFDAGRPRHAPPSSWRSALGFAENARPSRDEINAAYRRKAKVCHPDHGGTVATMAALNIARDAALKEVPA